MPGGNHARNYRCAVSTALNETPHPAPLSIEPFFFPQVLGLSRTQLTDAAALAFARALVDGQSGRKRKQEAGGDGGRGGNARCSLRRLDLSRNNIMDEGAR